MLKITKIKLNSRTNKCLVYYIENNTELEINLHFDIVLKYSLKKDMEIDRNKFEELVNDNDLLFAKNYAYNFVSYKPRTKFEVIQKLKFKDYNNYIISKVIDFLKEFDLLDDEKYALMYCKEKALHKSWGKYRIKTELKKKGVEENIILSAINSNFPEEENYSLAYNSALKKYNQIKYKKDQQKIRNSLISFLQRNGFEYGIIKEVIKEIIE